MSSQKRTRFIISKSSFLLMPNASRNCLNRCQLLNPLSPLNRSQSRSRRAREREMPMGMVKAAATRKRMKPVRKVTMRVIWMAVVRRRAREMEVPGPRRMAMERKRMHQQSRRFLSLTSSASACPGRTCGRPCVRRQSSPGGSGRKERCSARSSECGTCCRNSYKSRLHCMGSVGKSFSLTSWTKLSLRSINDGWLKRQRQRRLLLQLPRPQPQKAVKMSRHIVLTCFGLVIYCY
eukprot:Rmarinus@m.27715